MLPKADTWSRLLHTPPILAPYLPAFPTELGPLKVFPPPLSQSGATAVIKKEHHVF